MGFNHEPKVRFKKMAKKSFDEKSGDKKEMGFSSLFCGSSDCINNERERQCCFGREREREGEDDDYNESFIHACKCFWCFLYHV